MMTRSAEHADVHPHGIGREDDGEHVLQHDQEPQRGDEDARAECAALLELLVDEQVDQEPGGGRRQDGGGDRHEQGQVQELLPDVGVVGRQREDRAVGDVEVQRRAVDQPPAQRAQGVEAAHHEPGGEELEDEVHGAAGPRRLGVGLDQLLDLDLAALEHAHLDVHHGGVVGLEDELARRSCRRP